METADGDILMTSAHPISSNGPQNTSQSKEDLGDMTFCMSNYAKESLKMMYMMRQVGEIERNVNELIEFIEKSLLL